MRLVRSLRYAILLMSPLPWCAPRPARAESASEPVPPPIGGHVTDPDRKLTREEKRDLEALFGALQTDTKVDIAAWVAPVARADADAVGRRAYEAWHIGRDWKTGALLVLSESGETARLIVPADDPPLSPVQAAQLETALLPLIHQARFAPALRLAAERIGGVLRPLAKTPRPPPPGRRDLRMAARHGAAAMVLIALAIVLDFRRRFT